MITILAIIQSLIFFFLAFVHFNWGIGGKWGYESALPTNVNGNKVLNPKKADSFIVGFGLFAFSLFFLVKGNIIPISLPNWIINYVGWVIAAIFLLRAIGDFKYVGFFKKIKNTKFAIADSKYFSPLCFLLSIIAILMEIL